MNFVADADRPQNAPPGFHLLAKPSGSTSNVDCAYCFFPSKDALYPNEKPTMALMAQLTQKRRAPSEVIEIILERDVEQAHNAPCPCGSGNTFRKCHGDQNPGSPFSKLELSPVEAGLGAIQ